MDHSQLNIHVVTATIISSKEPFLFAEPLLLSAGSLKSNKFDSPETLLDVSDNSVSFDDALTISFSDMEFQALTVSTPLSLLMFRHFS